MYSTYRFKGCDLLENSYLCGSNNNVLQKQGKHQTVVICLKIPTFVVATTTSDGSKVLQKQVVICLKIPTFVVATTTTESNENINIKL